MLPVEQVLRSHALTREYKAGAVTNNNEFGAQQQDLRCVMASRLAALCLLLLHSGAHGFGILPGKSKSHQEITESAILNEVVTVCRDLAQAEATDFTFPSQPYTIEAVAVACNAKQSRKSFLLAITSITLENVRVDLRHALNGSFHFDEEMFVQGRGIIAQGVQAIKASNKKDNFKAARDKLGEILHPLQDFYSHSNWVELGKKFPNSNLIRSDTSIGNLADKSRATCRNCDGDDCTKNILDDVIAEGILTSGYFGIVPVVSTKPPGKCSHGGGVDQTSTIEPKGGINKDSFDASHGHLHTEAANMAIAASSQLLDDLRRAAGDRPFLQMLGISKGSGKALCFVIDTTSSMRDDIEAVQSVTSSIISSEVGTENEPSSFILVPFSDPEVGPLTMTTNAQEFKDAISSLSVTGGGDDAELSLSGLQIALSAAPLNSEIFLFTDAPAKDKNLKSAVIALIERTQTVVNFMITDSTVTNRRVLRRSIRGRRAISSSDAQVYRDLAQASGGLAIEVTKADLPAATGIITESTTSSLVTILQASRSPGNTENFFFRMDETTTDPRVYITGRAVTFTLISPSGVSQDSTSSGSLITSSLSVGNFRTLRIKTEAGRWEIRMVSSNPYTLKVIGQSSIDFLFDFVEESQGTFAGYDVLDKRPRAGANGTLLVTLMGSNSGSLVEVALVESMGSKEVRGLLESQGNGNYLVRFDQMPSKEFVVRVTGQTGSSSSGVFQRQSPTNFRTSNVTINADSNPILVPGTVFSVPFSMSTSGAGGNFTIRATNNQPSFNSVSPTSLMVESGNSTGGTVNITAPLNTPSGTDFTLTIEAEAPGGADINYIMLRFSVLNTVTDFTHPVCRLLSLKSNCSGACNSSTWEISVRVSDGDGGEGVERVSLKQGNGTLSANPEAGNANAMLVSYKASCCSPEVELLTVDRVGNVGSCFYSEKDGSPSAQSSSTQVTQSFFLFFSLLVAHVTTQGGIQ